jgi:hypothetical protein
MNCPNCNKEYFDRNQKVCEYCGSDLIIASKPVSENKIQPKSKFDSFIEDIGLKNLYNKIKKNLREL